MKAMKASHVLGHNGMRSTPLKKRRAFTVSCIYAFTFMVVFLKGGRTHAFMRT